MRMEKSPFPRKNANADSEKDYETRMIVIGEEPSQCPKCGKSWFQSELKIMNPTGEDVASAVRDWLKDDIKSGPSSKHDLGKFFLGISTGALGLFATLLKFGVETPALDFLTLSSFILFSLSALIGLWMARPPIVVVTAELNLYKKYNEIIRKTVVLMNIWFVLWLAGFVCGIWRLFGQCLTSKSTSSPFLFKVRCCVDQLKPLVISRNAIAR